MSDSNPAAPVKTKRSGCKWLLIIFAILLGLAIVATLSFAAYVRLYYREGGKMHQLQQRMVLNDIRMAVTSYDAEYNRFPIPKPDSSDLDVSFRSRGPMLTALLGIEDTPLNPKRIKFIELPIAQDRKFGLWQDGEEWVLSDRWGEPFYIVFDTNKDGKIANPESGADTPAMLPLGFIIYSSGPDRDPKTWQDNICSWRS